MFAGYLDTLSQTMTAIVFCHLHCSITAASMNVTKACKWQTLATRYCYYEFPPLTLTTPGYPPAFLIGLFLAVLIIISFYFIFLMFDVCDCESLPLWFAFPQWPVLGCLHCSRFAVYALRNVDEWHKWCFLFPVRLLSLNNAASLPPTMGIDVLFVSLFLLLFLALFQTPIFSLLFSYWVL